MVYHCSHTFSKYKSKRFVLHMNWPVCRQPPHPRALQAHCFHFLCVSSEMSQMAKRALNVVSIYVMPMYVNASHGYVNIKFRIVKLLMPVPVDESDYGCGNTCSGRAASETRGTERGRIGLQRGGWRFLFLFQVIYAMRTPKTAFLHILYHIFRFGFVSDHIIDVPLWFVCAICNRVNSAIHKTRRVKYYVIMIQCSVEYFRYWFNTCKCNKTQKISWWKVRICI